MYLDNLFVLEGGTGDIDWTIMNHDICTLNSELG